MLKNILFQISIQLNEKEKKFLIIISMIIILFLISLSLLHKRITEKMNKWGRAVDSYMYNYCNHKLVTNPKEFVKTVQKQENIKLYYKSRTLIVVSAIFISLLAVYTIFVSELQFTDVIKVVDMLIPKFKIYFLDNVEGEKIIFDFIVTSKPTIQNDLDGYIIYLSIILSITIIFSYVVTLLKYIACTKRGKEVSTKVFTKSLDNHIFTT